MRKIANQSSRLPGFEHIGGYWDPVRKIDVIRILAGQYYVTRSDEMVTTVLGSCVAACIRDKLSGIGGMNHFMLPADNEGRSGSLPAELSADACYGSYAMEQLINSILKAGGQRKNLEIKVFGGGRTMGGMANIGLRNISFVRQYLRTEGFVLSAEDVGDDYSRRLAYFPASGKVWVKKLPVARNQVLARQETAYIRDLKVAVASGGDVELFGA